MITERKPGKLNYRFRTVPKTCCLIRRHFRVIYINKQSNFVFPCSNNLVPRAFPFWKALGTRLVFKVRIKVHMPHLVGDSLRRQLTLNFEKKLIIRQILKDDYKESLLYCIFNSKVFFGKI